MQVNMRNVNFEVSRNPHVLEVNGKPRNDNNQIKACDNNEIKEDSFVIKQTNIDVAVEEALIRFKSKHKIECLRIMDIKAHLLSAGDFNGYSLGPDYYQVTITYTKKNVNSEVNPKEDYFFVIAYNQNNAINQALSKFLLNHKDGRVKIVDIQTRTVYDARHYSYYEVTIRYTKTKNEDSDNSDCGVCFLA
jgi:hypothetical protein